MKKYKLTSLVVGLLVSVLVVGGVVGNGSGVDKVTSLTYGIHIIGSTGSKFHNYKYDHILSRAVADAEEYGLDSATAKSAAAGIYLENGASQCDLGYIDFGPVTSEAKATTESGEAVARSEAFGILLQNSNDNVLQHIAIGDVTSKAVTERSSNGTTSESAFSYGILLQNSNRNTLKYIDVGSASTPTQSVVEGDDVAHVDIVVGLEQNGQEDGADQKTPLGDIDMVGLNDLEIKLENSSYNTFWYNVVKKEGEIDIDADSTGNTLHFNSFNSNVINYLGGTSLQTTLNWWGSKDGPQVYTGTVESKSLVYSESGGIIFGGTYFSPWLGADPDSDPSEPGVQPISPLPILVRRVGPEPTTENGNTGYLDMGIWGAGELPVVGQVIVPHGTWSAREPLGNKVELISETGSTCCTTLKDVEGDEITVNNDNVTIGKLDGFSPRGFIIKDEIVVNPGVDASTVHINWNDVRSSVENRGNNTLDMEYNWWDTLDPSGDLAQDVDYRPFLPAEACKFTDYMRKMDIKDPRAAIASYMIGGTTCSKKLPAQLITAYNIRPREAEELVDEYGCYEVRNALKEAGESYGSFVKRLS